MENDIRGYLRTLPPHVASRQAARLLSDAADEIERLQAIIDKLPKTADGVPIVPGMIAWCHHCGITRAELIGEFGVTIEGPTVWCDGMADADGLYGTRKAADAAGGE